MNVLALEFSTDAGSLALLRDGSVVASVALDAGMRRSQRIFDAVTDLLAGAGTSLAEVDAFAVGRGPGSYTGLRVSLTAANGWALPAGKPVWTVSSGAALAAEILATQPDRSSVVVWGDARRGQLWAGRFERGDLGAPRQTEDWQLLPMASQGSAWPEAYWVEPEQRPKAEWVGRLFFAGGDSEELQPVYLNPAVAIAPRFDQNGKPIP
jgi:tRNA threonylcarbamoyladenosine biosynthesis protein TsaB